MKLAVRAADNFSLIIVHAKKGYFAVIRVMPNGEETRWFLEFACDAIKYSVAEKATRINAYIVHALAFTKCN